MSASKEVRLDLAKLMEDHQVAIRKSIERYPLEVVYHGIRVVMVSNTEFDTFLRQLRADTVSAKEALNPTLVC
jgi:hypothetical protein